jgi:hypothetical protein
LVRFQLPVRKDSQELRSSTRFNPFPLFLLNAFLAWQPARHFQPLANAKLCSTPTHYRYTDRIYDDGMYRTRLIASAALLTLAATPLSTADALFDKTRFVLHLGAAYYAFHRWDLQPFQQGKFSAGAPGRVGNIVKGGLALAFAAHEISVARKVAANSNSPLLKKLDGGLNSLSTEMATIGAKLKGGKADPADLKMLDTATQQFSTDAAAAGQPIKDVPVPIPGL